MSDVRRMPVYKYFRGKWKELIPDEEKSDKKVNVSGYEIKDLDQKSVIELEELLRRQEKIMNNEAFLSKLQDKGEKVCKRYSDLQAALKSVKEKEAVSKKEKVEKNGEDINYFEWGGNPGKPSGANEAGIQPRFQNENQDEENNPLQLLARHSVEYPAAVEARREDDDDDPTQIIRNELEKLKIQDEEEAAQSATGREGNADASNFFGDRLLQFLNAKQKSGKKERFRTNRPLKKENLGRLESKDSKSSSAAAKLAQLIPLEESLKLMADTHNKDLLKMKSDAADSLRGAEPVSHQLPSRMDCSYRDTNATRHLLQEFEEEDWHYTSPALSEDEDDELR